MTEKQPGTAVVNWADEMAKHAVAVAKQETPSSGYISLKAGVLSYGGAAVPNNKLDVIVLDYAMENTYYEGKYDPNNVRSPVCFAIARAAPEVYLTPHPMSEKRQAAMCDECPNLKWGSDPGGGRGKACQERRRLIMIPANTQESPEKVLSAETAIMKLPVTSVKLWANYVATVATLNKRPPFGLVTQIGTQPNPKSQFNVTFNAVGALPDNVMAAIMQKREACLDILLKAYDQNGEEDETPTPKKSGKY